MTTANRPLISSSSSSSSHVEPNRLLKASKQGKVEEVRRLLKLGESIKQRDYKGNTPLHCASKRGHYAVVQLLVQNGAPVDLLNHSDKSPMELSIQPEITKLLALAVVQKKEASSLLVPKKQIFLESAKSGSSSSYPLHAAAKEGNSKELSMLLELGKKIDERDGQGNTPLHLASSHGHFPLVRFLVKEGASIQVLNHFKKSALDLAKAWCRSEIVNFLLEEEKQSVSSSSKVTLIQNNNVPTTAPSKDPEGQAYLQFEAAYEAGKAMDQIRSLEKLAELYLGKKDYFGAAHLINDAIAVATRSRVEQSCTKSLYQKLMEIEQLFLTKKLGLKAAKTSHPTYARNELKKIREGAARRFQQNKPIQEVQGYLTKGYKMLLCGLIEECIDLLGKGRPKGFAVMSLGSMARGEMCPCSDVEFAFIVRDPTQQNLAYFRRLSQLLTLKMINIGETKHDLIRPKRVNQVMQPAKSLTPTGFSMDIGGLCPEGKEEIYELIGSPEQLANFQTPEWLQQNESEIILANAMTTVCHVMGDESLITDYKKRIESILNDGEGSLTRSRLRERRAIELMRGYISEFKPRLDQDKIALRGFDVKQELYRLPQTVISGLALYYGICATSTSQRLRELVRKRVMSKQGADRLQKVFSTLLRLRVETHLFYGTEKEILYHSKRTTDESDDGLYPITKKIQQEIIEAYKTLEPLHQRAEKFVQEDKAAFANCSFCDETVGAYDDQHRLNFNFDWALQSSQVKAALNPNDPLARLYIALVQLDLGRYHPATLHFEEARKNLERDKQKQSSPEMVDVLHGLGSLYIAQGKFGDASTCISKALALKSSFKENKFDSLRISLINRWGEISSRYRRFEGEFGAVAIHAIAMQCAKRLHGEEVPHPDIADTVQCQALCSLRQGKRMEAENGFLRANRILLEYQMNREDEPYHPLIVTCYWRLCALYSLQDEREKSINAYRKAVWNVLHLYEKQKHDGWAAMMRHLGVKEDDYKKIILKLKQMHQAFKVLEQVSLFSLSNK